MSNIRETLSLRKIINAAGPITVLGGGKPTAEAIAAAVGILPYAVEMSELNALASEKIAHAFGCEAGYVTACSAAGITISIAAAICGIDPVRVAQLPNTTGLKHRVVMQRGHDANFGALVSQMIRLSGAALDPIGTVNACTTEQLRQSLRGDIAAAVYVVSHHTAQTGMIDLKTFCEICHEADVPVVVDAAGEHDLRDQLQAGADLVIASAHKNYGALTAGIVAGRRALVDACRLQDHGVGRPMKAGKESVISVIAALDKWQQDDRSLLHLEWTKRAGIALEELKDLPGVKVELALDMPGSPLCRARILIAGQNKLSADQLARALLGCDPRILVWNAGLLHGFLELDPRELSDQEMIAICHKIRTTLSPHITASS